MKLNGFSSRFIILGAASILNACGGGSNTVATTPIVPVTPPVADASNFGLTVGKTIAKTIAELANLANVANFVPTRLTTTDGTYANCRYDATSNSLIVTPKVAATEAASDSCTATFVDASGANLGPVNVTLANIDNKAPVIPAITPLDTTAGTAWTQTLPISTDLSTPTYSVKRANGSVVPLTGADYAFDPTTRILSGSTAITATETLSYLATDTAGNIATQNLTNTVDHLGTASISGPATSVSGPITLTLTANDADGIASWEVKYTRYRADGTTITSDAGTVVQSGGNTVPSTISTNIGGAAGQTWIYTFTITDVNNKSTSSTLSVLKV